MTFKKWLRKIVLFPLSVIMAIPDTDGSTDDTSEFDASTLREIAGPEDSRPLSERIMAFAGNPDAQFMQVTDAAAGQAKSKGADPAGEQDEETDDGLDTTSDEDDQGADSDDDGDDDESTSHETGEPEEGKQKGTKKRTVDERAREIAMKIVEEMDRNKSVEQPDFAPDEVVNKVKLNIVRQQAKIRDLQSDIELEGDEVDPTKVDELLRLEEFVSEAKQALKDNTRKRAEFVERQTKKQTSTETGDAARKELETAADMYRDELKIEPVLWDKMGNWFQAQMETSKLLVEEFNDVYAKSGKVAAIRFAHEYTIKNMGQKTKAANEKREHSKTTTASLTTSVNGKAAPVDLKKAKAEFDANPTDEAFIRYQALKRQAKA